MKANKVVVIIRVETLSIDSVGTKLIDAMGQIESENVSGNLRSDDGDEVTWDVKTTPVDF